MSNSRTSRWIFYCLIAAGATLFAVVMLVIRIRHENRDKVAIPESVTRQQYEHASEAFRLRYHRQPDRNDTLSWLAEWNLSIDKLKEAVDCFAAIPTSHPHYGRMARYQQGRSLLALHRAVEAEAQLKEVIALEESDPVIDPRYLVDARERLRHILEVELRFEERHLLLTGIIDRNENDGFEAVAFCFPSLLRWNGPESSKWLEDFHNAGPHDVNLEIALGRYRTGQGQLTEARSILERVHQDEPDNLRASAALIACLLEQDDLAAAEQLFQKLPRQSAADPWQLLLQRGHFALQQRNGQLALAAFDQVLEQVRTNSEAWLGVIQATRLTGDADRRKTALEMVAALGRIQNHLGKTRQVGDPNSFLDVAELCAESHLIVEGALMTRSARQINPRQDRVRLMIQKFQRLLADEKLPPILGPGHEGTPDENASNDD